MEGSMANKIKETVDYFPFFVKDGKTLFVLKKKHGLAGIGFFTELMRMLAQTPKHYYSYNDEYERLRLIEYIGIPEKEVQLMLEDMASTGKIDYELWHEHKIILSKDFIDSLSEAYRRRSGEIPSFENIKEEICRQYVGNMSETCHIKKRRKEKIKEEKKRKDIPATPDSSASSSSKKSGKTKKLPLREREPVNDMERVEKIYLQNWDSLYARKLVKGIEPVVNWNKARALLKNLFEKLEPNTIIQGLNNAMADEWVVKNGYTLPVILSAAVLNRLINANPVAEPQQGQSEKKSLE
jgi:hypothetical protein